MAAPPPFPAAIKSSPFAPSICAGAANIHAILSFEAGITCCRHSLESASFSLGAQCTKMLWDFPSQQLTTSARPSPSRSANTASSTEGVLPTVTAGQGFLIAALPG